MADGTDEQVDERVVSLSAEDPRKMGESTLIDYWFDLSEQDGTRRVVTYAYGMQLDDRSSPEKSFSELMAEVLPLIQKDIDDYGIAP